MSRKKKQRKKPQKVKKVKNDSLHSNVIVQDTKATISSGLAMIASSLTLVAGLAWNEVFKKFFEEYLKKHLSGWGEFIGLLIYALIVTLVAVLAVNRLRKWQKKVGGDSIKKMK